MLSDKQPQVNTTPRWLNISIVLLVLLMGAVAVWQFGFKSAPQKVGPQELAGAGAGARGGGGRGFANQGTPVNPNAVAPATRPTDLATAAVRGGGGRGNQGGAQGGRGGQFVQPVQRDLAREQAITVGRNTATGTPVEVKWEDVTLNFEYRVNRGTGASTIAGLEMDYAPAVRLGWLTEEETRLHLAAWRAANTGNSGGLALTDEQKKQINDLRYKPALSEQEDAKLKELALAWSNAYAAGDYNRLIAARDALLEETARIGKLQMESTKQAFKTRVEKIPTILTPDQLKQLGGGSASAGSAAPTGG
jgi:Spy/CpxP family protein refolding chaperone